jgi:hypothetical protein
MHAAVKARGRLLTWTATSRLSLARHGKSISTVKLPGVLMPK